MIDFISGPRVEAKSLSIIDAEAGAHGFNEYEWPVVRRMIHACADLSIMKMMRFANQPVGAGIHALKQGAPIVADSNMIKSGISISRLKKVNENYGTDDVLCRVAEKDVHQASETSDLPRAIFNMRSLKSKIHGGIVGIGNSPTALWEVVRQVKEEGILPALLIAMPVGFVNVVEAKALVKDLEIPYILLDGRRGGSPLVVAAINAISILAEGEKED